MIINRPNPLGLFQLFIDCLGVITKLLQLTNNMSTYCLLGVELYIQTNSRIY